MKDFIRLVDCKSVGVKLAKLMKLVCHHLYVRDALRFRKQYSDPQNYFNVTLNI